MLGPRVVAASVAVLIALAGCDDPAAESAAKQEQELEALRQQILKAGKIQEARAVKCVSDIKAHFAKAAGDKRGSLNIKPKDKMGMATAFAIDSADIGQAIEKVNYVRAGQACEDIHSAYSRDYKQDRWPDEARSPSRRHKHATETLAKLNEPAPDAPAAVAAYWAKCDKTLFKQYGAIALNNYACKLQVVWFDSEGRLLAAAAASGKGEPPAAPSSISEKTLTDLDASAKTLALGAAAADIAAQQAKW